MKNPFAQAIAQATGLQPWQVENTLELFAQGCTLPFVARYRKEATGSLDEVQLEKITHLHEQAAELEKRRESVLAAIAEQGQLDPKLEARIRAAETLARLEDLYLPYKKKRKTRATVARENGLEPLAELLWQQRQDPEAVLAKFLSDKVPDAEAALQGARDIIAERVSEDGAARDGLRRLFEREATIAAKVVPGKEQEAEKYSDFFDFEEPLRRCAPHRLLALRRGAEAGLLRVAIAPDAEKAVEGLRKQFVRGDGPAARQVAKALDDAYRRLLKPSIENEFAALSKQQADLASVEVFASNLRQLLLSPPLGQKRVLAIDPGFRTGCKLVCLDAQGALLHNETIFPHPPQGEWTLAAKKLNQLLDAYKIDAVAIGNGTAGRETEDFVRQNLRPRRPVQVFSVNEDGASIYSASPVAREEFPQQDVTVRGAVSIGRRLMDPLAELVKIDPKSLGVGQYQHDVDQALLKKNLDRVVESCVNSVGVNLNTASHALLAYVAGLNATTAKNIVAHRDQNGPFGSRQELKKVPRLGPKAFEQCAGFLRIPGAENPLDNSAVHPESYPIVEKMARDRGLPVGQLIEKPDALAQIELERYLGPKTGLPTLRDILDELRKPGRDPRPPIRVFEFADDIRKIEDLKPGMVLPGIVTNMTRFGVFIDLGIKQNGLVHISELADRFVSDPAQVVQLNQHVRVKVLEVDLGRGRVQLSLKQAQEA